MTLPVSYADILKANDRISTYIHRTPVFTSSTCNKLTGRKVYFKAENLQKTGSFKARGAVNAVLSLRERGLPVHGVITHSSGNHGQALAWAAAQNDLDCCVVVPRSSPRIKMDAIESYGAELVLCEPNPTSRQETCAQLAMERELEIIPASDMESIIAGQGTIALEFLEAVPELDAILVVLSGGGMAAGVAIAAKEINPNIKVFAVEPEGKMLEDSLRAGKRLWPNPPQFVDTIADSIRSQQVHTLPWPIILKHFEKEVFTANSEDMISGMRFAFQRMKLVVEAAAGAAVWSVMSEKMKNMDDKLRHVGVILCGGNIDIDSLPWV